MKRPVRIAIGAPTFAILAAVLIFWHRSYSVGDYLNWHRTLDEFQICSSDGLLRITTGKISWFNAPLPRGWEGSFWPFERERDFFRLELRTGTTLGFGYEHRSTVFESWRALTLPYWVLVAFFAGPLLFAAGLWLLKRRTRRRRTARGLCVSCGYDLRESEGRCPEFGTVPAGRINSSG